MESTPKRGPSPFWNQHYLPMSPDGSVTSTVPMWYHLASRRADYSYDLGKCKPMLITWLSYDRVTCRAGSRRLLIAPDGQATV